jgi:glycerol-3-phosphate dehydrogenase
MTFARKKLFMNKKEYDLLIVGAGIYGASDDLGRRV